MPSFIGRTKLEPVSIIILSVVMGMASLQLIRESGQKISTLVTDHSSLPDMGIATFVIAGSTVGKSGMLLFADHKACVPRFGLVELFNGELLRAIRWPKTHYFYDRLVSQITTQRHFFSTLHPLSTVIFAADDDELMFNVLRCHETY